MGGKNTSSIVIGIKAEYLGTDTGRGDAGKMREFLYGYV